MSATIEYRDKDYPVATGANLHPPADMPEMSTGQVEGLLKLEADALGQPGYVVVERQPYGAPADGWAPGCAVFIHSRWGWLRYACGTFDTVDGNLAAIVRTLAALRAAERHGVLRGEQYQANIAPGPDGLALHVVTGAQHEAADVIETPESAEQLREKYAQTLAGLSGFIRYTDPEQNPPGWRKLLQSPVDVRLAFEKAVARMGNADTADLGRAQEARRALIDWHEQNGKRLR